jgi:hypothetical protein
MSTDRIKIADGASGADIAELRDKIHEFNFATTGYRDGRSLSCFLRESNEPASRNRPMDGFVTQRCKRPRSDRERHVVDDAVA